MRGVCDKPRVKCGECPNQAFIPVGDEAVFDHLQGRHVIGVYPMLDDGRCWLLAVDFDKQSWVEDVGAFVETCRSVKLSVAVERSRSGSGAHVWFFFSEPVPAATARKMGCYLITETMTRRHELSLESYDRLFPNQDTLPRGGFGNLIALPLQRAARQRGNTVFVDDALVPFHDQWAFLAGIRQIDPGAVEAIADEGTRRGEIIGLQISQTEDVNEEKAWAVPSSTRIIAARCRCGIAVAEDHVADAVFIMVYGIRRTPRLRIAATTTLAYLCGVARNEWRWSRWRHAREADVGDPARRTSRSTDGRRRSGDDRAVRKRGS